MVAFAKPDLWNNEPVQVQRGDVWQLGRHRLMCGDSADTEDIHRLMDKQKADTVISDPPFAFAGGISNGFASRADSQFFEHWLVSVFRELYQVCTPESPWFLWSDWRTATIYDTALQKAALDYYDTRNVSQVIVHDREMVGMGSPFRNQVDWIVLIRGKKTDFKTRIPKNQPNIIRSYWYYGKHAFHPAEKSLEVTKQLIEWSTDERMTVLDLFLGCGTTLLACEQTDRTCYGMEQSPEHCNVIIQRWQNLTGQKAQQAMAATGLPPAVPGSPALPGQTYPPPPPAPGQPAGAQPPASGGKK